MPCGPRQERVSVAARRRVWDNAGKEGQMKRTKVDASCVVNALLLRDGRSARAMSRDLGRGLTYVSTLASNVRGPSVESLVRLAEECGYEVELRVGGKTARIVGEG